MEVVPMRIITGDEFSLFKFPTSVFLHHIMNNADVLQMYCLTFNDLKTQQKFFCFKLKQGQLLIQNKEMT